MQPAGFHPRKPVVIGLMLFLGASPLWIFARTGTLMLYDGVVLAAVTCVALLVDHCVGR